MSKNDLNEMWKNGLLKTNTYYFINLSDFVFPAYLCHDNKFKTCGGDIIETNSSIVKVLDHCSFWDYQRLKNLESKYSNIKVNGNYCDKISRLKSRIKALTEENNSLKNKLENNY